MKELREKAKIEYVGNFAVKPAAAGSAPAAAAPEASAPALPAPVATPATPAASGLDADSISKGMGIK
jgi:hypothetical protein